MQPRTTSHPPAHYDVVVVGARAAGAAAAMLAARAGLRVLVVDRTHQGADTLSTHALMRGGVLQLHRWGILDRIVDAGTPAVHRATFHLAGGSLPVDIKPAHGVDALYAPRRTVLDPILVQAAADAGADVRFGLTARDVLRDDARRVCGVSLSDAEGTRTDVRADVVVGADGMRSTIADRVGATVERRGGAAMAVVYGYWSDVPTTGYEWGFRSGTATGLIPTNDGLTCVFAGATPRRVGRGGRAVLERLLEHGAPDVAARVRAGVAPAGVRTFTGRPGEIRRAWGPGWALVGDAGYWKDPISAHGLTDALRDAELLARAVVEGLGGTRPLTEALASYQAQRDELSLPLFEVTDELAALRWTDDEVGALLMRFSVTMNAEVDALVALDGVGVR